MRKDLIITTSGSPLSFINNVAGWLQDSNDDAIAVRRYSILFLARIEALGNIDVPYKWGGHFYEYVNIAQTSEVIGTVQEESPVWRASSTPVKMERNWQILSLQVRRSSVKQFCDTNDTSS